MRCAGLNGYTLQTCLREVRKAREAAAAAAAVGADKGRADAGSSSHSSSVEEERLKMRQYEQPGTLVTLPSGKCASEPEQRQQRVVDCCS